MVIISVAFLFRDLDYYHIITDRFSTVVFDWASKALSGYGYQPLLPCPAGNFQSNNSTVHRCILYKDLDLFYSIQNPPFTA